MDVGFIMGLVGRESIMVCILVEVYGLLVDMLISVWCKYDGCFGLGELGYLGDVLVDVVIMWWYFVDVVGRYVNGV